MTDKIAISDAMQDPTALNQILDMIGMMRAGVTPLLNADPDNLPHNQSLLIAASALMAGMTVGHMIALGLMLDQDKRRAGQTVLANFRNGIEQGKAEARKAMLSQLPAEGRA